MLKKILPLFCVILSIISCGTCSIEVEYYSCGLVPEIDKSCDGGEGADRLYIHNISGEKINSVKIIYAIIFLLIKISGFHRRENMRLPIVKSNNKYRRKMVLFGGINRTQNFADGELYDCEGVSHLSFPSLTQACGSVMDFECNLPSAAGFFDKKCVTIYVSYSDIN